MKILHYTTLFVILIGSVIASGDIINSEFCEAVDQGNLNTAVKTWETGNTYKNAKYLVGNASTEFVIKFTEQVGYRYDIVAALYTSGSEENREKLFEKVSFTEFELAIATRNPEIPCQLEHFIDLLERLSVPRWKAWLIEVSTSGLFTERRTECIGPLLNALKGDKDLEYKTARKIFSRGVYNYDEARVKHSYDHSAISPDDYAEALIKLVREKGVNNPIFKFLLKEADQDDLKALLNDEDYKKLNPDLRFAVDHAIEEALPEIKPAGSRHKIVTSRDDWTKRYPEEWKSHLYMVLAKGSDPLLHPHSQTMLVYFGLQPLLPFIRDGGNVESVQEVLRDTSKTPLDMCDVFVKKLLPGFAVLTKDYYKEQRDSLGVSNEFNEFDVKFYRKLSAITSSLYSNVDWDKLKGLSNKKEVMCEAVYFYDLIDFERAITCLDAAPPAPFDCKVFSNFVADMYFGEASRPDFSYEGDVETRKWLDDMVKKYKGNVNFHTTSLMRRFTQNIRGQGDDKLWNNYMRAMMTVHLSAVLLWVKVDSLKDMYEYLADNHISEEYTFASLVMDPLQPGQTVRDSHAFLRTFKLDPSGETATMGIINSGAGIGSHDHTLFNLSELPDTISRIPNAESVFRYIPFNVYDEVPKSEWEPAYTTTDSMDKAYFGRKQKKHEFSDYKKWQYIDDQRAGTCTAMSLWSGLYWFERESQQKLESFRLGLYLEVLKGAAKELGKLRKELREMGDQIFEMDDDDPKRDELQSKIDEKSETEDDYLRFFSVAFNSAIRSIRYLHDDPFKQGLNMTSIMQDYADFYESQASEKYWKLVKPNIDDLFHSTYLRILNPTRSLPSVAPKISAIEHSCVNEVNQAIKVRNPFNFVKAIVRGTDLKCQSKKFLTSIHFGVDALDLQTHHQELILRALTKEIRSLSGGRLPILRLVHKLVNDYSFKLFPAYDVQSKESIDFTRNTYQVVLFEDDMEMKQFAVNCTAFDLVGKNVLAAAHDLVKSTENALPGLATRVYIGGTEEYKLYDNLFEHVITELQSIDPHLYAQYLGSLIWNDEQTGIAEGIFAFKPSKGWDQDDYDLLKNAAQNSKHYDVVELYIKDATNQSRCKISHAIITNSPSDFIKAVAFATRDKCTSELFLLSITVGIETLKLEAYHQNLILHALSQHKNAPQMLALINKLVTKYSFKLFLIDNTLPKKEARTYKDVAFALIVSALKPDDEARQLAANINKDRSLAGIILTLCTEHNDLTWMRPRFVDHVFGELQAMDPHLHAYHLSRLINQKALKPEDFTSIKPRKEWDDYDYVLIESAVTSGSPREVHDQIFNFPKEYHINTENAPHESEFESMSTNPSDEILKGYATMLFKKMEDGQHK